MSGRNHQNIKARQYERTFDPPFPYDSLSKPKSFGLTLQVRLQSAITNHPNLRHMLYKRKGTEKLIVPLLRRERADDSHSSIVP